MARNRQSKNRNQAVVGVAWYRAEQWDRLRQIAVDGESMHESYDEWHAEATQRLRQLQFRGIKARKVDVDLDELIAWCDRRQLPLDGSARSQFVAVKAGQLDHQ